MKRYEIKQLQWQSIKDKHSAKVFDMKYTLWHMGDLWRIQLSRGRDVVFSNLATSLEDGKKRAQLDFNQRVKNYLLEVGNG